MASKNCDKFITPTIRVSCWAYLKTVLFAGIVDLNENLKVPAKETDLSWYKNFIDDIIEVCKAKSFV